MKNIVNVPRTAKLAQNYMCVPCEGTVTMEDGPPLSLTDKDSKPLKAAGEVINWWLAWVHSS